MLNCFVTLYHNSYNVGNFLLGQYMYFKNCRDVLKIEWLPITERRDFNLLKSCFTALKNTETEII